VDVPRLDDVRLGAAGDGVVHVAPAGRLLAGGFRPPAPLLEGLGERRVLPGAPGQHLGQLTGPPRVVAHLVQGPPPVLTLGREVLAVCTGGPGTAAHQIPQGRPQLLARGARGTAGQRHEQFGCDRVHGHPRVSAHASEPESNASLTRSTRLG
jgi:hypothetical protein